MNKYIHVYPNPTNEYALIIVPELLIGKEYKIGVVVSVNVSALRKDLEDAGMIKSLNAGF